MSHAIEASAEHHETSTEVRDGLGKHVANFFGGLASRGFGLLKAVARVVFISAVGVFLAIAAYSAILHYTS